MPGDKNRVCAPCSDCKTTKRADGSEYNNEAQIKPLRAVLLERLTSRDLLQPTARW